MNYLLREEDSVLVERFMGGDSSSIDVLYNRYRMRLFNYIKLLVGSPVLAEDILQDTFLKAIYFLRNGKYSEKGRFLPWIYRIAHNIVIDYYRTSKKSSTDISKDSVEYDILAISGQYEKAADYGILTDQTIQFLRIMVDKLPKEQREVVLMRHYGNMSFEEIAERTNVSINTALGRMRYALINLRKMSTNDL